jgi:hypothetical protein
MTNMTGVPAVPRLRDPTLSDAALFSLTNALQPVRRSWMQAVGKRLAKGGLSTSLATVVLMTSRFGPRVQGFPYHFRPK